MKGQTLIEVLVALAVIIVITTALASVVVTSISNSQFSKDQNLATQYTQEGMETIQQIRDSDYVGFRAYSGTYCLMSQASSPVLAGYPASCNNGNIGTSNFYKRIVSINRPDSNCNNNANLDYVRVAVYWTDGKCPSAFCRKVELESCMSIINPNQSL